MSKIVILSKHFYDSGAADSVLRYPCVVLVSLSLSLSRTRNVGCSMHSWVVVCFDLNIRYTSLRVFFCSIRHVFNGKSSLVYNPISICIRFRDRYSSKDGLLNNPIIILLTLSDLKLISLIRKKENNQAAGSRS